MPAVQSPPLGRRWATEAVNGGLRVTVHQASLDAASAQALGDHLLALARDLQGGSLSVDLGEVTYLSDTCLGKLLALHRQVRAGGGRLTLLGVSPEVYEMFEFTHLSAVFNLRGAA